MKKLSEQYFEKINSNNRPSHVWYDAEIKRYGEYCSLEGQLSGFLLTHTDLYLQIELTLKQFAKEDGLKYQLIKK